MKEDIKLIILEGLNITNSEYQERFGNYETGVIGDKTDDGVLYDMLVKVYRKSYNTSSYTNIHPNSTVMC